MSVGPFEPELAGWRRRAALAITDAIAQRCGCSELIAATWADDVTADHGGDQPPPFRIGVGVWRHRLAVARPLPIEDVDDALIAAWRFDRVILVGAAGSHTLTEATVQSLLDEAVAPQSVASAFPFVIHGFHEHLWLDVHVGSRPAFWVAETVEQALGGTGVAVRRVIDEM